MPIREQGGESTTKRQLPLLEYHFGIQDTLQRYGKWFPGTWESRGESESLLLTWVLFSLLMEKFGKMSQH
ncbi:unnamed protein product [Prunus armeniaca]